MLLKIPTVFPKTLCQLNLMILTWDLIWLASATPLIHSLSALLIPLIQATSLSLPKIKHWWWWISSFSSIWFFQVRKSLDLARDFTLSCLKKVLGQCGLQVANINTIQATIKNLGEVACIHSLWSKARKKTISLASFSEIPMLKHPFFVILMMEGPFFPT